MTVSTEVLAELSKRLSCELGIHFPAERLGELPKRLHPLIQRLGLNQKDYLACLATADWGAEETQAIAECLTVPETYFFRDSPLWQYLSTVTIPSLVHLNRRMAIWSAGCCTGDEPYTAAIMVDQLPKPPKHAPLIVGSDLNAAFIERAIKGQFGAWSLRAVSSTMLERYFQYLDPPAYMLDPKICGMVKFKQFNLIDLLNGATPPSIPPYGFDLIFCRNVLIYFPKDQARAVIERMHKFLSRDGILIVSTSDIDVAPRSLFELVQEPGVLLLRKRRPNSELDEAVKIANLRLSLQSLPVHQDVFPDPSEINNKSDRPAGESVPLTVSAGPAAPSDIESLIGSGQYQDAASQLMSVLTEIQSSAGNNTGGSRKVQTGSSLPSVDNYLLLLRALSNLCETDQALAWADKALKLFPLHEGLYYFKAVLLQQAGRYEEALRPLKQSIFVDCDFVMAHFCSFMLLNRLGRHAQAEVYRRNTQRLLDKLPPDAMLPHAEDLSVKQINIIMNSLGNRQ